MRPSASRSRRAGTACVLRDAEQLQSAVPVPLVAEYRTGEMCIRDRVLRYEDSVGTKFEPGTNIRITYVFYPNVQTNEQRTLIGRCV